MNKIKDVPELPSQEAADSRPARDEEKLRQQQAIRDLHGKLAWQGDLNKMRTD